MSAMSQGGRFALPEGTVREINDVSSQKLREILLTLDL